MQVLSAVQTTPISKTQNKQVEIKLNKQPEPEYKNLPDKFLNSVYDDSNTFGMFLKENKKAMEVLDKTVAYMPDDEKQRFLFVAGHVGMEHILKAHSKYGLDSPTDAIPYVQNELNTFKNNDVFADSLQSMFKNKESPTETDKLLEFFYDNYVNSYTPMDVKA